MGAWGHGPFENDDAGDWVLELEESEDFSVVQAALESVTRQGGAEIEAPDCSIAVAAAEVVAASLGRPVAGLPDEAATWVAGRGAAPKTVVALAKQALMAVKSKSELRDLWEESDCFGEWVKSLVSLEARLAG
jgi:hypothetical protein